MCASVSRPAAPHVRPRDLAGIAGPRRDKQSGPVDQPLQRRESDISAKISASLQLVRVAGLIPTDVGLLARSKARGLLSPRSAQQTRPVCLVEESPVCLLWQKMPQRACLDPMCA